MTDSQERITASDELVAEEMAKLEILGRRTGHGRDQLTGLALSGGGIRSATFALGVMQALHRAGLLTRFDYLSTVSGGGYIGSSLTWSHHLGSNSIFDGAWLEFLRKHGNFLTPGDGLNVFSGLSIVLRAIFLNLVVWLPVMFVLMALCLATGQYLACILPAGSASFLWAPLPDMMAMDRPRDFLFLNALWLAGLGLFLLAAICLVYSLQTFKGRGATSSRRYESRRFFEILAGRIIKAILALVVFGAIPLIANKLEGMGGPAAVGPLAVLLGIASGARTFFQASGDSKGWLSRIPLSVWAVGGAALFFYGLATITYSTAAWALLQGGLTLFGFVSAAIAIALLFGFFVNINYISLHRFYRDRLMEAFLPNPENIAVEGAPAATTADSARMSDMFGSGPYHIVNTNVVLTDSDDRIRRMRGGDSFILSPIFSGSAATGWVKTQQFANNSMTLPTAMAISGAAANPSTGVGGVGLTRNPMVALLMAFLNIRLGYWAANPATEQWTGYRPNHFWPGASELLSLFGKIGFRENSTYIHLSDGGHFENLGIYELVRRKVRVIVACDAGADAAFSFGDLQNALHRIKEDFGATVDFGVSDGEEYISQLIPQDGAGFPATAKIAKRGYVAGTITYRCGAQAKLILLKTTLVKDLPISVLGYKGANPDFPDQSTADQFFDENQFDAYRELGLFLGTWMIDHAKLRDLLG